MQKLSQVLNDPESMKQINELAQMLSAESAPQPPKAENSAPDLSQLISSLQGNQKPPPPKPQPDLSQLISGLMGANHSSADTQPKPDNNSGQRDLSKLIQLQTVMEKASKSDKNVDLLLALKPLLKEENQEKIDKLVKIFKLMALYPVLKESGLLGGDLLGFL